MFKIFLVSILILLTFILIPIKIVVHFEYSDKYYYDIKISYLFGLIKKQIDSNNKMITINKKGKLKVKATELIGLLIDKGNLKKFNIKVNIGMLEPSILGISIGVIWTIINVVLSAYFRNSSIEKVGIKSIEVNPYFNVNLFEVFFSCIIKLNIVYIITTYIKLSKMRKGEENIARTSYRRFDANYND